MKMMDQVKVEVDQKVRIEEKIKPYFENSVFEITQSVMQSIKANPAKQSTHDKIKIGNDKINTSTLLMTVEENPKNVPDFMKLLKHNLQKRFNPTAFKRTSPTPG